MSDALNGLEIAVIGISGKFPGAKDITQYWNNLINAKESITFFSREELTENGTEPENLSQSNYVNAKGYLEG